MEKNSDFFISEIKKEHSLIFLIDQWKAVLSSKTVFFLYVSTLIILTISPFIYLLYSALIGPIFSKDKNTFLAESRQVAFKLFLLGCISATAIPIILLLSWPYLNHILLFAVKTPSLNFFIFDLNPHFFLEISSVLWLTLTMVVSSLIAFIGLFGIPIIIFIVIPYCLLFMTCSYFYSGSKENP